MREVVGREKERQREGGRERERERGMFLAEIRNYFYFGFLSHAAKPIQLNF